MIRTTKLKKPQVPNPGESIKFDDLNGRPKYGGVEMTSSTDIPTYESIHAEIVSEAGVRRNSDIDLQKQIDAIVVSSDVKDIVGTKAELDAYDTSSLGNNDIIKVLADETQDGATTYYRWSTTTEVFTLIGSEGPYYTKGEADTLLGGKQDTLTAGTNVQINDDVISATDTTYTAGTNVQISNENVISATDTTYSDFSGATPSIAGANGLVPAPTTSDSEKYLKGDGTWGTPENTAYTAGANVQISDQNVISATDTTYTHFTGATSIDDGTAGLVPAPIAGDESKFLKADGTWATVTSGGGSYSAGNGISIDANNEISIDTSVVAEVGDIPTKTSELTNNGSDNTSVYVEADELATVATSGSYNDLLNTPTIPAAQVNSDWDAASGVAQILNKPSLATVATSGDYGDLLNKPTIPAAQVNSDWNANSGVAQILNKPTIPAAQIQSDWTQADNTQLDYIKNKPTIPTVNDGTLTITQNGTSAGTFSANASAAATIALTDTTYSAFTGATSGTAGTSGLVPAPASGDDGKYLKGDGTWGTVSSGSSTIIGTGAPTSSTTASVGQFYLDTQTGVTYICTDDTGGTYVWATVDGGASITVSNTDPGEYSPLPMNSILGVYGTGSVIMDYSTTEQATGYTWTDGSMIYKKTVNFGALPNSAAKTVAHSITSLGKFIKLEGYGRKTSGATYPLPYASAGSGSIELYADSTNIEITTTNDRSDITECYITLYYIKGA